MEAKQVGGGPLVAIVLLPAYMAGCYLVLAAVAIALKWVLLGRQREGVYPLWGGMYLRW